MKAYEKPTMEIVTFKQDVITASGGGDKLCDKICDNLCEVAFCEVKYCDRAY